MSMYGPQDQQTTWRNLSRHEESFNDLLYEQLRKTPWWLISIAFHGLLVLVMLNIPLNVGSGAASAQLQSKVEEDVIDPIEDEVKPDIEETKPIEQDEKVIEDPVVKDAKVSDHNETDNDLPFEESLGKKDFISDAPFEGPSTNSAIGIGGGAGGAFGGRGGHRNLKAEGGGAATQSAVNLGLEWLKDHQDDDGKWDSDGFMKHDKIEPICDGPGYSLYDPGVSGLALLAFLGAGQTHKRGRYKRTVKRGLKYLKQIQDPEGCFGSRTDRHFVYSHATCALAMAEAYGLTGSPLFKQSAQMGIDFVIKCQNPYLAWRYGVRPGDNDTSVSGWMMMSLKSAKLAGLRVPQEGFDGLKAWLDKVTEPEYGKVGYTARGTGPARTENMLEKFPPDKSESLTAVGVLARIFMGENPETSEMIQKGTELCLKALPVWDESSGTIDMYYWYYGTLAIFQVGGEPWKKWNAAIKDAIIDHQRKDGAFRGSWDPAGPWGPDGGRVYSTALCVMCMEVYYRYGRVFGTH